MFNIHEIEDDYDVFVAFEIIKNRGKKLTNLELLKNRLIYLTTLYNKEILEEQNEVALREMINKTSVWRCISSAIRAAITIIRQESFINLRPKRCVVGLY